MRRPPTANDSSGNTARADRVARVMTTIGLIGAGHIGSTVARLAVAAGHDVVLSNSRGPETLADLVAELGPTPAPPPPHEAAAAGDIVVVTIPLRGLPRRARRTAAGKVVIDTNNYYPAARRPDRRARRRVDDQSASCSRRTCRQSHVVKAFNHIYFEHLGSPSGPPAPGPPRARDRRRRRRREDDGRALLDDLGYDALDVGPLAEGWRYQRDTPATAPRFDADGLRDEAGRGQALRRHVSREMTVGRPSRATGAPSVSQGLLVDPVDPVRVERGGGP